MPLHQELHETLEKLAAHGNEHQIAAYLETEGMLGNPYVPRTCPVSQYLRARLGTGVASVGPSTALVVKDGVLAELPLPPALTAFVDGFDRGDYPELQRADYRAGILRTFWPVAQLKPIAWRLRSHFTESSPEVGDPDTYLVSLSSEST